jgi:hypothetical protein
MPRKSSLQSEQIYCYSPLFIMATLCLLHIGVFFKRVVVKTLSSKSHVSYQKATKKLSAFGDVLIIFFFCDVLDSSKCLINDTGFGKGRA